MYFCIYKIKTTAIMKPISPIYFIGEFCIPGKDIEMINNSEAEWIHIDIMDGVFVPNISFGFPVLKFVAELRRNRLMHLICDRKICQCKGIGAHVMNVHFMRHVPTSIG